MLRKGNQFAIPFTESLPRLAFLLTKDSVLITNSLDREDRYIQLQAVYFLCFCFVFKLIFKSSLLWWFFSRFWDFLCKQQFTKIISCKNKIYLFLWWGHLIIFHFMKHPTHAPPMHQYHAWGSLPFDPNPILTPPNIYATGLHDTAADDIFLMVCILINWRKRPKENKEKDHRRDYFNHSLVILFQYLLPNF